MVAVPPVASHSTRAPSSRSWRQPCSWPAASPTSPAWAPIKSVKFRIPAIETHDQGCVPEAEFVTMADAIASTLSETSSFENQWGLGAIRADQAYANLELQHGPDVAPGEGVLVGVLDTGIDAAHFSYGTRTSSSGFCPAQPETTGRSFPTVRQSRASSPGKMIRTGPSTRTALPGALTWRFLRCRSEIRRRPTIRSRSTICRESMNSSGSTSEQASTGGTGSRASTS